MKVAEQLLDKGLGKGNLKIVRAMRIPTARKPGPFKIELESQEAKKEALAETGRLHYYKAQGQKVIIRSSMRFEDRIQKGNWDTMRRTLGLENQLRLSKHGKLLPNNYQQQQQPQMQHQQPQMSQQQQPYAQQQPQMQQPQMPYQQPQMHQQQPHAQQPQMWQQPIPQQQWQQQRLPTQTGQSNFSQGTNTNVTYSGAVQAGMPRAQNSHTNAPVNAAQPGMQTNQFRFSYPPTSAPGY